MNIIRNWPEGLYMLMVMFGPLGVAFYRSDTLAEFLLTFVKLVCMGLVAWIGAVVIIYYIGVLFERYCERFRKSDDS